MTRLAAVATISPNRPRGDLGGERILTGNAETESVGVFFEEALEERRFPSARWAADHQWTQ